MQTVSPHARFLLKKGGRASTDCSAAQQLPKLGKAMFKNLKKIKTGPLLTHLIITLAYPAAKAFISSAHRLMIFTDAMTFVSLVLLAFGLLYSWYLHGDFDLSGFLLKRGVQRGAMQSYQDYIAEQKEKREEAFNYPLFLGLVYLAAAIIIAYGIL